MRSRSTHPVAKTVKEQRFESFNPINRKLVINLFDYYFIGGGKMVVKYSSNHFLILILNLKI